MYTFRVERYNQYTSAKLDLSLSSPQRRICQSVYSTATATIGSRHGAVATRSQGNVATATNLGTVSLQRQIDRHRRPWNVVFTASTGINADRSVAVVTTPRDLSLQRQQVHRLSLQYHYPEAVSLQRHYSEAVSL